MSKSAILSSSIAKKYWMALTGLFLCLFLVGHLAGNLQLILITGEEGKRAFNEYAFFMTSNPAVKLLSYLTYASILFHSIDGFVLAMQNKKARPQNYAHNRPGKSSSTPSRYMAILGTVVLVFICTHMVNFWGKMHFEELPLHTTKLYPPMTNSPEGSDFYLTTSGSFLPADQIEVKNGNQLFIQDITEQMLEANPELVMEGTNPKFAEGYKDLHGLVMTFFGKPKEGFPENENALIYTWLYVLCMAVLGFHLWHGFSSAFQSLGLRTESYKKAIIAAGKGFAVVVATLFAIIPLVIYYL
ncbi:MAG: succinate dehydrogenase / fumarate reductase cytochrome b subunit [Lentimonas sp.]|jgi:succinate dehydrogenase / fumarate reductase cytochrome b subunit